MNMYPPNSFFFVIFPVALILLAALRSLWIKKSQKQQQVVGTGAQSAEPTTQVNPADSTPPPKYEQLAPPSYEEASTNYPGTQPQHIVYPMTDEAAQSSTNTTRIENTPSESTYPETLRTQAQPIVYPNTNAVAHSSTNTTKTEDIPSQSTYSDYPGNQAEPIADLNTNAVAHCSTNTATKEETSSQSTYPNYPVNQAQPMVDPNGQFSINTTRIEDTPLQLTHPDSTTTQAYPNGNLITDAEAQPSTNNIKNEDSASQSTVITITS